MKMKTVINSAAARDIYTIFAFSLFSIKPFLLLAAIQHRAARDDDGCDGYLISNITVINRNRGGNVFVWPPHSRFSQAKSGALLIPKRCYNTCDH